MISSPPLLLKLLRHRIFFPPEFRYSLRNPPPAASTARFPNFQPSGTRPRCCTTLSSLLPAACSLRSLSELHARAVASGEVRNPSVVLELVDQYLALDLPQPALSVFWSDHRQSLYLQNGTIRCLADYGFFIELLDLYRRTQRMGCRGSDGYTFPSVVRACSALSCLLLGREVHAAVLKADLASNAGVQTSLLDMYAKMGRPDVSRKVFDCMTERDYIAWNAIIFAYSSNGCHQEALEVLHHMQLNFMKPNAANIAGAVSCVESIRIGRMLHALGLKLGNLNDEKLVQTMISMYASFGDLCSSRLFFDQQHFAAAGACNSMILAYVQNSRSLQAFEVLRNMISAGINPSLAGVVSVLSCCSDHGCIWLGESVHAVVMKSGRSIEISVAGALVSMYSKLGQVESAELLLDEMPERNLFVWNSMSSCYVMNGEPLLALSCFQEMQLQGVCLDSVSMINAISCCKSVKVLQLGKSVHAYSIRNSFDLNNDVMNALLSMYCELNGTTTALTLFRSLKEQSLVAWNSMISGFANAGKWEASIDLFGEMRCKGIQCDLITLAVLISCAANADDITLGTSLHAVADKNGCIVDSSVANSLITLYTSSSSLESGRQLFEGLSSKTQVSYNALMTGYRKNGLLKETMVLLHQMLSDGFEPNVVTLLNVLPACESQLEGKAIHCLATKGTLTLDLALITSMMTMYSRFGNIRYCNAVFRTMKPASIPAWNALMSAYVDCEQPDMAVWYFRQLLRTELRPDSVSILALISACSALGSSELARCSTGYAVRNGWDNNISVVNSLIHMLAKCGSISSAEALFGLLTGKDSVSWSVMINAYRLHGDGEAAVDLFLKMKENGGQPDDVTLLSVLSACSHAGLVEHGRAIFRSMRCEGTVMPRMEHYSCMVDLLGRTGHVGEALELLQSLPGKPSVALLFSLLGACQHHGETEAAKAVADLLAQSGQCSSTQHVVLSNLFAAGGNWGCCERVRRDMDARGLKKTAAFSVITAA